VLIDPRNARVLSQRRLTTKPMLVTNLSASRDGRRLAFAVQSEVSQLWSYPFDDVAGLMRGEGRP